MFIFLLSPNKKKTIYTVLEFTFMFIFLLSPNKKKKKNLQCLYFLKKVLKPGRLEYCINGTRIYQTRVPQNFLETHKSNSAVPRWKTNEKLEFQKKWYFAIYFRNSVFLLKISKNCGIRPFWPKIIHKLKPTSVNFFPFWIRSTSHNQKAIITWT